MLLNASRITRVGGLFQETGDVVAREVASQIANYFRNLGRLSLSLSPRGRAFKVAEWGKRNTGQMLVKAARIPREAYRVRRIAPGYIYIYIVPFVRTTRVYLRI